MMLLLDLPVELLQAIAAFTVPEGIESFALSCQALHSAAQSLLAEHNEFCRRYRRFRFTRLLARHGRGRSSRSDASKPDDPNAVRSHLELLLAIVDNPLIARYIEDADLRFGNEYELDSLSHSVLDDLKDGCPRKKELMQFLAKSSYLAEANVDPEEIANSIAEGPDNLLVKTFVLTLLPNVKTLIPSDKWEYLYGPSEADSKEDAIWRLLDTIVQRANLPQSRDLAALAELETLGPSRRPDYERRLRLQAFTPFLSLPKLKGFYSASILAFTDGYTGTLMLDTRYPSFGRTLENLWMEGSCVDDGNIRTILSSCPVLKSFRLSFETKWHGCGHDTDLGHFVRAVEDTTCETLEHLTLDVLSCFGSTGTGVVTMKKFKRLKTIEIGLSYFTGPPCGGKVDQEWDEAKEGQTAMGDNETPPLTEIFPSCVEELTFLSKDNVEHLDALGKLFNNLDKDSLGSALPNLRNIVVELEHHPVADGGIGEGSLLKAARSSIQSVGAELSIVDKKVRPIWEVSRNGRELYASVRS